VATKVQVVIPTAATFDVDTPSSTTRFATGVSTAVDTKDKGLDDWGSTNASAEAIRITPNLTPATATGQVIVKIIIEDIIPPI
jgi:hypothetical protein